jgi:beta-1,4-mannosyl-glycoprotein beta-1,4-N-acetylglucosaminyltransferase
MKIVDAFIFYNELDMLQYRLSLLYDIVDHFILVESTRTFIGKSKPLYYQENRERFSRFQDKIVHVVVDDLREHPSKQEVWDNERFQRNCIDRGIRQLSLDSRDIIIIGDVDEIPDDSTLLTLQRQNVRVEYANLLQDFYYYNLTCKNAQKWHLAKLCCYEYYVDVLQRTPQKCREIIANQHVKLGGWHLSYFGGAQFIRNKIENFSHQEFNSPEFTDIERIDEKIKKGEDLFSRSHETWIHIPYEDNDYLPTNYRYFVPQTGTVIVSQNGAVTHTHTCPNPPPTSPSTTF